MLRLWFIYEVYNRHDTVNKMFKFEIYYKDDNKKMLLKYKTTNNNPQNPQ
jgi:hypothetical protein